MSLDEKGVGALLESNQGSPLEALGVGDTSDNLLDEMLGEIKPGRTFGGFMDAKEESRKDLQSVLDDKSERVLPGRDDDEAPESEPTKQAPEQAPDWYAVNHEQQVIRQRQEALERTAAEERQQTQNALNQLLQQSRQKQQEQEWEDDYSRFEDPDAARAYDQRMEQKIQQHIQAAQAPLLYQMAADRFTAGMAEASSRHEHFHDYYPKEKLNAYFAELSKRLPVQQLASVNWAHEWAQAYRAADYDRLDREVKANADKASVGTRKQENERQSQKDNLKLVPKASQSGTGIRRSRLESDLDRLSPKLSFGQFGREMKKLF